MSRDECLQKRRQAWEICDALKDAGILVGTDRPHHNVLKIRPPMPFDDANADELVSVLEQVLARIQP